MRLNRVKKLLSTTIIYGLQVHTVNSEEHFPQQNSTYNASHRDFNHHPFIGQFCLLLSWAIIATVLLLCCCREKRTQEESQPLLRSAAHNEKAAKYWSRVFCGCFPMIMILSALLSLFLTITLANLIVSLTSITVPELIIFIFYLACLATTLCCYGYLFLAKMATTDNMYINKFRQNRDHTPLPMSSIRETPPENVIKQTSEWRHITPRPAFVREIMRQSWSNRNMRDAISNDQARQEPNATL